VVPENSGTPVLEVPLIYLYSDRWLEHYGALGPEQLHGGAEGSSRDLQSHPILHRLHQC
jgi:hypothetical protein